MEPEKSVEVISVKNKQIGVLGWRRKEQSRGRIICTKVNDEIVGDSSSKGKEKLHLGLSIKTRTFIRISYRNRSKEVYIKAVTSHNETLELQKTIRRRQN